MHCCQLIDDDDDDVLSLTSFYMSVMMIDGNSSLSIYIYRPTHLVARAVKQVSTSSTYHELL